MVAYRRNRAGGACYFFTATLRDRNSRYLTNHIDLLRESIRRIRAERPFTLDAIVILPEHLHSLWTLPPDDADYSGRWRAIKSAFTRALVKQGIRIERDLRGEYGLWQRRFWEHTIRDERDYATHVEYIHFNPVRHGHVSRVIDWPYSSFHQYVKRGLLPADWGGGYVPSEGGFGELP
jgi:putative transposase